MAEASEVREKIKGRGATPERGPYSSKTFLETTRGGGNFAGQRVCYVGVRAERHPKGKNLESKTTYKGHHGNAHLWDSKA